jgi:hypothetical protein
VTKGNGHRVASHASCQVGQSALYKRDEINNWLGQDTGRLFPLTLGSGLDSARELRRVQDTRYLRGLYRHCLPLGRGRSRCYPPSREIHRERERERAPKKPPPVSVEPSQFARGDSNPRGRRPETLEARVVGTWSKSSRPFYQEGQVAHSEVRTLKRLASSLSRVSLSASAMARKASILLK